MEWKKGIHRIGQILCALVLFWLYYRLFHLFSWGGATLSLVLFIALFLLLFLPLTALILRWMNQNPRSSFVILLIQLLFILTISWGYAKIAGFLSNVFYVGGNDPQWVSIGLLLFYPLLILPLLLVLMHWIRRKLLEP